MHNENTVFDSSGLVLNRQIKDGIFVGNWIGYRGSVDIYYDINQYNSITSNIHVGGHDKFNNAKETVSYIESIWMNPEPIEYLLSDTSSNKDTEYEYTLNYIKTFPDKEGQELMVQVSKDPISTKGARVTNHISIAGRHLVYIPLVEHIGISRRITQE